MRGIKERGVEGMEITQSVIFFQWSPAQDVSETVVQQIGIKLELGQMKIFHRLPDNPASQMPDLDNV